MSFYLSPLGGAGAQFFTDQGTMLAGGLINTYLAGSTTPAPTYQNASGSLVNPNPIVLNAEGRPPAEVWLVGGSQYKMIITTAAGAQISPGTFDNISGINDPSGTLTTVAEWIATNITPVYANSSQFTLAGNVTATLTVNRRLQITQTGGVVYGYVSVVSYNAGTNITTITAIIDSSGSINSGIIVVNYALLSSVNVSVPQQYLLSTVTSPTFSGTVTAPSFTGPLTGNVTGNATGTAGSATSAATATNALQLGGIAAANWWGNNQSYSSNLASASRFLGTPYTNSTGRTIWVTVTTSGSNANVTGIVNGVMVANQSSLAITYQCVSFVVPAGLTYEVSGGPTLPFWFEYA
jgi:hypothetical protein